MSPQRAPWRSNPCDPGSGSPQLPDYPQETEAFLLNAFKPIRPILDALAIAFLFRLSVISDSDSVLFLQSSMLLHRSLPSKELTSLLGLNKNAIAKASK